MLEPLVRSTAPAVAAAAVRALGASLRELELLLALPAEARAGRIRLPLDELERVQAEPRGARRSRPGRRALRPWCASGTGSCVVRSARASQRSPPAAQSAARGLIVWAALSASHSARAARDLPRARLTREHHAALDGWRAWRAARRAQAGDCRLRAD